jgi:glycosyltransferase involved in cell wall biosynthesis
MWEWFSPAENWARHFDVAWSCTRWTTQYLESVSGGCVWKNRIVTMPWGVDLQHFRFSLRSRCLSFLFANGTGGFRGRKGASIVAEAARMAPNAKVLMMTQDPSLASAMPSNVEIRRTNLDCRADVYREGDVLVAPSRWEGFGLPLYEAQACGIPVITTDHPPMNECGASWLIPPKNLNPIRIANKVILEAIPSAAELGRLMTRLSGQEIHRESQSARRAMEAKHDLLMLLPMLHHALEMALSS